jgi:hypothetical protein
MITSAAACCTLAIGTGMATASAAPAPAPAGHWGNTQPVPGLDSLNAGKTAYVTSVSCAPRAPGECAVVGNYDDGTATRVFVADEKAGTWGEAGTLHTPALAATGASGGSVSCGAPGNCVAVATYSMNGSPPKGFFDSEENGRWDQSADVSGGDTKSDLSAVSCAPNGTYCAVGGSIYPGTGPASATQPVVWDEKDGVWGMVQPVQGLGAFGLSDGDIKAMSCPSPGNCGAVGSAGDASGQGQLFVVDERNGIWGNAQPVPGMSMLGATGSFNGWISCAAAGNCTLGGTYIAAGTATGQSTEQVFIVDEVNGSWGSPQQVPGTGTLNRGGLARLNGVSCGSPGNCAVAGFYTGSKNKVHAFTADEKNGTWRPVRTIAGAGLLAHGPQSGAETVSCASAGNCMAGGWFEGPGGTGDQAFTASEVNGRWGGAHVLPGSTALNKGKNANLLSLSCAKPGNCAGGGDYFALPGLVDETALVADESTATSTRLSLSAAKARFGHEQAERLTVTVTARTGGTPGGTVAVTANEHTVCNITLTGGKGTCALAARKLNPGSYRLTGHYAGDGAYDGSASAAKTLTVTK